MSESWWHQRALAQHIQHERLATRPDASGAQLDGELLRLTACQAAVQHSRHPYSGGTPAQVLDLSSNALRGNLSGLASLVGLQSLNVEVGM